MKWFNKFYSWVRPDGYQHVTVSAFMYLVLAPILEAILAALVVLAIGVGKELYDRRHEGHAAEWHDVICDAIGVVLGVGLHFWPLLFLP